MIFLELLNGLKKSYLKELALFSFFLVGLFSLMEIKKKNSFFEDALLLKEGIDTCFTRVGQMFISSQTGLSVNQYKSNSFVLNTEKCFEEYFKQFEQVGPNLSFYEDAHTSLAMELDDFFSFYKEGKKGDNLRDKEITSFQKIESLKNAIADKIVDYGGSYKLSFFVNYASVFSYVVFFFALFSFRVSFKKANAQIEKSASLILKNGPWTYNNILDVFSTYLDKMNLPKTKSLLVHMNKNSDIIKKDNVVRDERLFDSFLIKNLIDSFLPKKVTSVVMKNYVEGNGSFFSAEIQSGLEEIFMILNQENIYFSEVCCSFIEEGIIVDFSIDDIFSIESLKRNLSLYEGPSELSLNFRREGRLEIVIARKRIDVDSRNEDIMNYEKRYHI